MSRLLSQRDLDQMRADVETLCLPDTCNILTSTLTNDGEGGQTIAWGTATANEICRLDAYNGKEFVIGGQLQPFHGFVLTLPYDATIEPAYRVEVGSKSYSVISVDGDKSWATTIRCALEVL
jgi:hypothetical protein